MNQAQGDRAPTGDEYEDEVELEIVECLHRGDRFRAYILCQRATGKDWMGCWYAIRALAQKYEIALPDAKGPVADKDPEFQDFTTYLRLPEESASRRQTAIDVVGFLGLLLLGIWFAHAPAIKGAIDAQRTSHWVEAEGTIQTSRVAVIEGRRKVGEGYVDSNHYGIQATYEYTVNGKPYTSDQLRVGTRLEIFDTESQAHAAHAAHFSPGTPVTVYINPTEPREAYLFRGTAPGQGTRRRWFGNGLMLLAGLAAVKTIRQFRRRRYFEKKFGGRAVF